MRNPERIDRIIEKLRKIWKIYPDQRLCQLVWNLAYKTGHVNEEYRDVFHTEDDELEFILNIEIIKIEEYNREQHKGENTKKKLF